MKTFTYIFSLLYLIFQTSFCISKESINVSLIPDLYHCHHHFGLESKIQENSTLGIIATKKCTSNRPTYGDSNSKVTNTFSRVFIPWRYSLNGAFKNGYLFQSMLGVENSEFRSEAGSSADVSFIDFTFHGGYQWFWGTGFNISALVGVAYLKQYRLEKDIVENENRDVIDFLDKNTKSNVHIGSGVIFGWVF